MLLILSLLVSKGKKPIAHYGCANMNGPICKSCIDITYLELFSHYIQVFSRLAIASWIHSYFENAITKVMVNNRTEARKLASICFLFSLLAVSKPILRVRILIVFINK